MDTKQCPVCAETIKAEAKVCRFCGRDLEQKQDIQPVKKSGRGIMWLAILLLIIIAPFLLFSDQIILSIIAGCIGLGLIIYALATGQVKFLG